VVSTAKSKAARREARDQSIQRYRSDRVRNQISASPGVHDFIVVLDNLKPGFNVPKIFRSAEIFGACEVQLINVGPFDPAPAVGAFRRVPARFYEKFQQSYEDLTARGYTLLVLEPRSKQTLSHEPLPRKSAFIFGHEQHGISIDRSRYPALQSLSIPQFGRTDSLNVSVAASIVMYEYIRRFGAHV